MSERLSIEAMKEKWGFESINLPDGYTFEWKENQSRQTGTGYKNYIYQIFDENGKKTNDAFIVGANLHSQYGGFYNSYTISENYYSSKKEYAQETSRLSKKYGIEYATGLALDCNEKNFVLYSDALKAVQVLSAFWKTTNEFEKIESDLYAGISRRKNALQKIFKPEVYSSLGIDSMEQEHSARLARDCAKMLNTPLSQKESIPPQFQKLLVQLEIFNKIEFGKTQTDEGKAFDVSITPLDEEHFAVALSIDNSTPQVQVASFTVHPEHYETVDYEGDLIFNDEAVAKLGEALYGDKTIGELYEHIQEAVGHDYFADYTVGFTASELGIEQNDNEDIVIPADDHDEL